MGKENNDKDSDRTVQSNLSARGNKSSLAVSAYERQYTIVLKDLLKKFDVTSATMPDTTGVTVLENPSKHVKGTSSVGNRHGLITVVGCSAEREEAWGDKEKSEYQQYLSSYERRIQSRLDATNHKVKTTKGGNQKSTKKSRKLRTKWRDEKLFIPRIRVKNPLFEPIAELFYGTDNNNLIPIKALLDTGARAERVLTACTLMSRRYFEKAIRKSPESFRYIATAKSLESVVLIDGTRRVQVPARYYEFGLKAMGRNGRIVTDHVNIAVVDKCIDAYQIVLGVDQFRRIKPEFPDVDEKGNWIRFHGGPWKDMVVSSRTDHFPENDTLDSIEAMPEMSLEQKDAVNNFREELPTVITMPSMTCIDVRIDQYLTEELDKLEEDQAYVVRLNPRALASDLTALEVIITTEEIKALKSGISKNLLVRINNLSKGKRSLHLDDLFRVEKIGSNNLMFSLPGYKFAHNDVRDLFGELGGEDDGILTEEKVAEMLDECEKEFTEVLQDQPDFQRGKQKTTPRKSSVSGESDLSAISDAFTWTEKLAKETNSSNSKEPEEKSFKPIPMFASLTTSKVSRKPVSKLYEQKSGQNCYLIDFPREDNSNKENTNNQPTASEYNTITATKWINKNKDLSHITVFDDYKNKKVVGRPNDNFEGTFKIARGQIAILSEKEINWKDSVVFLQKASIEDLIQERVDDTIAQSKLAGMSKNSYKHEKKKQEDSCLEDDLLKEIAEKKEKVMALKPVDTNSSDWKAKVEKQMRERFSKKLVEELERKKGLDTEFTREFAKGACHYHEEGCPTPHYKCEEAGVLKKDNPTWKVLPYFNLSHLDAIRLSWIVSEEVRKGNLVKWEPGMELPLHASPAFIAARKGHLTGRMVVDFRVYNQQIKMPCFSMPNSEDILADLTDGNAEYFGASDLATGYFHAQLSATEEPYLAITTKDGMYFSKKLQLGPAWAPAWFQSRSRSAFPPEFHVYIDDILFKAKSAEELLERIRTIHESCDRTGFVLSLKKTYYGVTEVDALGHTITTDGRCAAQGKIDLIKNWKFPDSTQNLKSFVCVLVYLRDYIWRFAEKCYPLKKYLRGKDPTPISELATDDNARRAIQLLKNSIATKATIRHIDREAATNYKQTGRPVMIYCDASQYAKSFVICQKPSREKAPQIAVYKSRSFSETERKWSTLERELNAILYLVEEGIRYIEGVPAFLLFDHKNLGESELQTIWVNKQKSDKISRWCDRIIGALTKLQIRRHYLPGQLNILADIGSRYGYDTSRDQSQISSNVEELVKSLFNTTDGDAKSIENLVKTAEKELDEESKNQGNNEGSSTNSKFASITQNYNNLNSTVKKIAALTVFSRLAASNHGKKDQNSRVEQDFEPESKEVFDNEKTNEATQNAHRKAHLNFDVSAWRDKYHYAEAEYQDESNFCAMEDNVESELHLSVTQSLTTRGYNYVGRLEATDIGMTSAAGNPVQKYEHYETFEKTTDKNWKPTEKDVIKKREEIEKRSMQDPKWNVVTRVKDDTLYEGYKETLVRKKYATKKQKEKARADALTRTIQDLRMKILESCPEPESGFWYILQLDLKKHTSKLIKRWRSNYAFGPIQDLDPQQEWAYFDTKKIDNDCSFKRYKLKDLKDNSKDNSYLSENNLKAHSGSEIPAIGGRDLLDGEVDEYPVLEKEDEALSNDENFQNLEPEELESGISDLDYCSDVEMATEDEGSYDLPEGESDDEKSDLEKLLSPRKETEPKINNTKSKAELLKEEEDRCFKISKRNFEMKEKERLSREKYIELYEDLREIIAENHQGVNVWSRDAHYPEWEENTKKVFRVIEDVPGAKYYNRVDLIDSTADLVALHPKRIYKIVLLTTENTEPRIFPAMNPLHFSSNKHQIKITEFLENINSQPETVGHELTGVLLFSRETLSAEREFFFNEEQLENLKVQQKKCKETKWKLGFLDRTRGEGEAWLKNNLTKAQLRVETLDRKQNHFEVKEDLLYMNHRLVIPRCLTKDIYGNEEDQEGNVRAKFLRTYLISEAHRFHHDNQTTRTTITDEWGLNWPRIEKDVFELEKNCLFCIIEKPVPKYTNSYVSEIYAERNQTWFLDHQGPFGPKGANFFLLTIIDDATGRVWIRKVKDKFVTTVIPILRELFNQCDPYRLPAQISVHGTPDTGAPGLPLRIRADNGFGIEVTKFCRKYAKDCKMAYVPAFIPGTAENPSGQHRVERPHRAFRRWINALHIEGDKKIFEDEEVAEKIERRWNWRRAYGKFAPFECYFGRSPPFHDCDLETANDYRNQSRLQLVSELTALRQARSNESHRKQLSKYGLVDNKYNPGDLVVIAHLSAKRKSKQSCLGNYRCQIFRVERNQHERNSKYNRVYLTPAIGDRPILFKQPVNTKKLRPVPNTFLPYLTFESEPDSAATENFCQTIKLEDLIDSEDCLEEEEEEDSENSNSDSESNSD